MADLHDQTLVSSLDTNDRIAAGRPGQEGAKNIRFDSLVSQVGQSIGSRPARTTIANAVTSIPVTGLAGTDYEVEIIAYTTAGADFGNATNLANVSGKIQTQFTLTVPSDLAAGILLYRILDFNL